MTRKSAGNDEGAVAMPCPVAWLIEWAQSMALVSLMSAVSLRLHQGGTGFHGALRRSKPVRPQQRQQRDRPQRADCRSSEPCRIGMEVIEESPHHQRAQRAGDHERSEYVTINGGK
jgi:hypothetical protein